MIKILKQLFFDQTIERALFNAYLVIFLGTAAITLVGLTPILNIPKEYFDKLFTALVLEVVAGMVALFGITFLNKKKAQVIRLSFEDQIDLQRLFNTNATCSFIDINSPVDSVSEDNQRLYRITNDNGPCISCNPPRNANYVRISVSLGEKTYVGSLSMDSRLIEMQEEPE